MTTVPNDSVRKQQARAEAAYLAAGMGNIRVHPWH
jgi:hypothetical protein